MQKRSLKNAEGNLLVCFLHAWSVWVICKKFVNVVLKHYNHKGKLFHFIIIELKMFCFGSNWRYCLMFT